MVGVEMLKRDIMLLEKKEFTSINSIADLKLSIIDRINELEQEAIIHLASAGIESLKDSDILLSSTQIDVIFNNVITAVYSHGITWKEINFDSGYGDFTDLITRLRNIAT